MQIQKVLSETGTRLRPQTSPGYSHMNEFHRKIQIHMVLGVFLTGREEVVDGPGDIEWRQLQTLGQTGKGMTLDSGRFVHLLCEQHALDQKFVWQEAGKVRVITLPQPPLRLLQHYHYHIHREESAHHLHRRFLVKRFVDISQILKRKCYYQLICRLVHFPHKVVQPMLN